MYFILLIGILIRLLTFDDTEYKSFKKVTYILLFYSFAITALFYYKVGFGF